MQSRQAAWDDGEIDDAGPTAETERAEMTLDTANRVAFCRRRGAGAGDVLAGRG